MATTKEYVVTRFDHGSLRSVAISKPFTDIASATDEAVRMNAFDKYSDQFLMVDIASFVSVPVRRVINKAGSAPCR